MRLRGKPVRDAEQRSHWLVADAGVREFDSLDVDALDVDALDVDALDVDALDVDALDVGDEDFLSLKRCCLIAFAHC